MSEKRLHFAAIDIGSNAVRLLIKRLDPGEGVDELVKSLMVRVPLRLGEDVFGEGAISPCKEKQLRQTIKSFKLLMKVFGVVRYRACATSAMREAANGTQIAVDIERKTGVRIEVIDGDEEARIVYESHIADLLEAKGNYIYVDVGGGSTEISLIRDGELVRSHSYDIGTVRILKGKVKPAEWEKLQQDMDVLKETYPDLKIIGSGGNINKLYRLGRGETPRQLPVQRLRALHDELAPLDLDERMARYQLNPDRADVIVPAAEIFLTIAARIGAQHIWVPTIGIIDGITHSLCADYLGTHKKHGKRQPSQT